MGIYGLKIERRDYQAYLSPVVALLVLLTPLSGQAALLTGLLLVILVALHIAMNFSQN